MQIAMNFHKPAIMLLARNLLSGNRTHAGKTIMTNICLLLDTGGMGGIESHVAELAIGLGAAGDGVTVLFLQDRGPHPLRDRLDAAGIAWHALPGGLRALSRYLRGKRRPALLHTHGYKANILGRIAGRLAGIPVVASYHAGEKPPGMVGWYDRVDRWTSLFGGRIAVSRPILDRLPFGGRLVPNFVTLPPAFEAGPAPEVVAFVGRMSHEKGPDLFCQLAKQAPGPDYVAFGGGAMLGDLRAAHGGTVAFHGPIAGMDREWCRIGVLAVPSRAEGLPLAVLEAMANGVPVAAFAVGALPEVIQDGVNGFLVPPGDLAGLAGAVRRWSAMDRGQREALRHAARHTVAQRFGRDAGIQAIRACYAAV